MASHKKLFGSNGASYELKLQVNGQVSLIIQNNVQLHNSKPLSVCHKFPRNKDPENLTLTHAR